MDEPKAVAALKALTSSSYDWSCTMVTWSSPNKIIDLEYYQTVDGSQLDRLNQKLATLGIPTLLPTDFGMSKHFMISSLLLNVGASRVDLARLWLGEAARCSRYGS
jgi:hypothetical protein